MKLVVEKETPDINSNHRIEENNIINPSTNEIEIVNENCDEMGGNLEEEECLNVQNDIIENNNSIDWY